MIPHTMIYCNMVPFVSRSYSVRNSYLTGVLLSRLSSFRGIKADVSVSMMCIYIYIYIHTYTHHVWLPSLNIRVFNIMFSIVKCTTSSYVLYRRPGRADARARRALSARQYYTILQCGQAMLYYTTLCYSTVRSAIIVEMLLCLLSWTPASRMRGVNSYISILMSVSYMFVDYNSINLTIPVYVTPSPPTKSFPTKSSWVKLSGRIPFRIKSLLESNPPKPKLLVGGLGVDYITLHYSIV